MSPNRARLRDLGATDEVATWIDALASVVLEGGGHVEFGGPGFLSQAPLALSVMLANAEFVHLVEAAGADLEEERPTFVLYGEGDWGRVATVVGDSVSDPVGVPLAQLEGMAFSLRRGLSRNLPWSSVEVAGAEEFDDLLATYGRAPHRIASRRRVTAVARCCSCRVSATVPGPLPPVRGQDVRPRFWAAPGAMYAVDGGRIRLDRPYKHRPTAFPNAEGSPGRPDHANSLPRRPVDRDWAPCAST